MDNTAGDDIIVLAHAGAAVDADPVNGQTYFGNAAFGSGSQIGTGNYVVYIGTGTSVSVTSLTANTTYHFAAYSFNSGSKCYNTTNPATGSGMTTVRLPVITEVKRPEHGKMLRHGNFPLTME